MNTSKNVMLGTIFSVVVAGAWLVVPRPVTAQSAAPLLNGDVSPFAGVIPATTQSPTTQSSATQSSASQGPTPNKPAEAAPAVQKPGDHAVVSHKNSTTGPRTPSLASAPQTAAPSSHTAAPSSHK
jgi:hypothetical protein